MPIYEFEHPQTKEVYEDFRKMSDSDKPFMAPDGTQCKRILSKCRGWKGDRECFELDPEYVKKARPNYVRYRDGHREKYNPSKHR